MCTRRSRAMAACSKHSRHEQSPCWGLTKSSVTAVHAADLLNFPARFSSPDDPGDAGWAFVVSLPGATGSQARSARIRANLT
jgi:hypothetical protein